jgi:hypothetical protein
VVPQFNNAERGTEPENRMTFNEGSTHARNRTLMAA